VNEGGAVASVNEGGAVAPVNEGGAVSSIKDEPTKLYDIIVTFSNGKPSGRIENIPERYIGLSSVLDSQAHDIEEEEPDFNKNSEVYIIITDENSFNYDTITTLFNYITHLDNGSDGVFLKYTIEQYYELHYETISDIETGFTFNDDQKYKSANLAHFLDIPIIVESLSNLIANDIKGKTPDEIRTMLGLEDDLSLEQKAEIEREIEAINLIQATE